MNQYFLIIACLQLFPALTPISPVTTWTPLIIIFAITATKEFLDDYQRLKADKVANERLYSVLKDSMETPTKSRDICVGDILCVKDNEEFPCDMVLIHSSESTRSCYVLTSNLDGETDLKTREAPKALRDRSPEELKRMTGVIECPLPNSHIYEFDGVLNTSHGESISISPTNLLLQGTILKNTDFVFGVVVYTGNQTKLGNNKNIPSTKLTSLDTYIDKTCLRVFALQLTLVLVFGLVGNNLAKNEFMKHPYLYVEGEYSEWYHVLVIPTRMLLLMSFMIPISLKVTLDMVKYLTAQFITWDIQMYDEQNDIPAFASSTAIAEDLGQIEYVMSDKTGTLTMNQMIFKYVSIGGRLFGSNEDGADISKDEVLQRLVKDIVKEPEDQGSSQAVSTDNFSRPLEQFFTCLAVCHSILPASQSSNGEISGTLYQGSSPDEEALVTATAKLGVPFISRSNDSIIISVAGDKREFKLLNVLEFSSDRKRMSVIVKTGSDIYLFTKGADDVVMGALKDFSTFEAEKDKMEWFGRMGYRSLCVAYKKIEVDEYELWSRDLHTAMTSLQNRERLVQECYAKVEANMELLGITAIEDALQEMVPETIEKLRLAGIKVWMLTGDRRQTAIQIGKSCSIIQERSGDKFFELDIETELNPDIISSRIERCELDINNFKRTRSDNENGEAILVVSGNFVNCLMKCHSIVIEQFVSVTTLCSSLICCRVTPNQKASIVSMIKDKGHRVLAIGDGGNDVAMLQKAHIGVGIHGREGLQAVRASDYSIGKFMFLGRLILVHGRMAYKRASFVGLYCFYKSAYIGFTQGLYEFLCGFSGTSFFNTYSLTTYNLLFTGLPIVFFVLDKDIIDEDLVYKFPKVYKENLKRLFFNGPLVTQWFMRSFYQACVTLLVCCVAVVKNSKGLLFDSTSVSITGFTIGVLVQNCTLLLNMNTVTTVNSVLLTASTVLFFVVTFIASSFPGSMNRIASELLSSGSYWFAVILGCVACIIPFIAVKYFNYNFAPLLWEKIHYYYMVFVKGRSRVNSLNDEHEEEYLELLHTSTNSTPNLHLSREPLLGNFFPTKNRARP
ncbi:hypothetical protein MP638_004050 [Amoeboaphelidium occidentale]|nr:hypothetical protein MP638_004050 [Amoeboaphelidium occidentale]